MTPARFLPLAAMLALTPPAFAQTPTPAAGPQAAAPIVVQEDDQAGGSVTPGSVVIGSASAGIIVIGFIVIGMLAWAGDI